MITATGSWEKYGRHRCGALIFLPELRLLTDGRPCFNCGAFVQTAEQLRAEVTPVIARRVLRWFFWRAWEIRPLAKEANDAR